MPWQVLPASAAAAVVTSIVAWQIVVMLELKPRGVLPGQFDVLDEAGTMFQDGACWIDSGTSLQELLIGLAAAIVVGLPVAPLIGWSPMPQFALPGDIAGIGTAVPRR